MMKRAQARMTTTSAEEELIRDRQDEKDKEDCFNEEMNP
jgi:hypothetical protein